MLKRLWTHPTTLGTTLLIYLGLSTSLFLLRDIYTYYYLLPSDVRGTLSRRPSVYVLSGGVRLIRWARGLDGTDAAPIRRFVEREKGKPIYAKRFLQGELEQRRPPRPTLLNQGIPQRQVPQVLDKQLSEALEAHYHSLAAKYPQLTIGPSKIEPNALALFYTSPAPPSLLHPDIAPEPTSPLIELAHIHHSDNSQHVILSPLDAVEAIERGWAVRFPLAGGGGVAGQEGRVMVYAPRDGAEVGVVGGLTEGGVRWVMAEV